MGRSGRKDGDPGEQLDRQLLARYAPPAVLVNERMEVIHRSPSSAGVSLRSPAIHAAVRKAARKGAQVRVAGVTFRGRRKCNLVVTPLVGGPKTAEPLFVVLFEARAPKAASRAKKRTPRYATALTVALSDSKAALEALIAERDERNEELSTANEELLSGNEELQSLNEEMETAKEELQATNEQLTAMNDELRSRNDEVSEVNSDLVNILATVDVPILILDRARQIRRFTPKARQILNVISSDIGRPLDDVKSNLLVDDLDAQVAEVIETNVVRESEVQDRDARWYRMQIRPYQTTENVIEGATLSLVDINLLKHHISAAIEAKAEAERANRAKDDFLATLSHEIRTPLSTMLMHSQMLQRTAVDPAKVVRAAAAIERGTRIQVDLIDDILDVSRIVSGKLRIDFRAVDFSSVVAASVEAMSGPAEKKKLTVELRLPEKPGLVSGDPTRLQQIVTNLLGNAIKFTPEGGSIAVSLEREGSMARLTIRDEGIGIDPEFLPHVFERFAQEDAAKGRRHGGLGLGLAIVQHLVQAHGGTIRAESKGSGTGSAFIVELRVIRVRLDDVDTAEAARALGPPKARARSRAVEDRLDGIRILVVDDDELTREAVAEILGLAGATVQVVTSAAEALRAISDFEPQVLLCDIAMPDEDGYSLIRKLRALGPARGGDLPAVALTALAGEANRAAALEAGFQKHIAKPIEVDALLGVVAELAKKTSSR